MSTQSERPPVMCAASVTYEPRDDGPGKPYLWPQTTYICSLPWGHHEQNRTPHGDGYGFSWSDPT